jgi:hypothetical protein
LALNFNPLGKKITDIVGGFGNFANEVGKGVGNTVLGLPVISDAVRFGQMKNPTIGDFTKGIFSTGYQNSPVGALERTGGRIAATITGTPQRSLVGTSLPIQQEIGNASPLLGSKTLGRVAAGAGIAGDTLYGASPFRVPVRPAVSLMGQKISQANKALGEVGAADLGANIGKPKVFTKRPLVNVKENPDATYQVQLGLPTSGVKPVRLVDKAFRSTRSIIERQGPEGQKLADMLRSSRDAEELHLAQIQKTAPTLHSLRGKDFGSFVDAVEGKVAPATPKIAKAVEEWRTVAPAIRNQATKVGLDVGDLGPKYYPHFIDFEKLKNGSSSYNRAINHLVSTGQAQDIPGAIKLLNYARDTSRNRKFGNLEASRIVDLPGYDKTPDSLRRYLQGSTRRIAHTQTFGSEDQKALNLLAKIGEKGGDVESAKNAFNIAVGAKRYGADGQKISNAIRSYNTTTRLGLGAISNAAQNVNTGIVTGHLRTLGALVKQLKPSERSYVQSTGVISDAVINDLREQAGLVGKGVSRLTAPGFQKVETLNRSVAATAGKDYALRLAQKGDEATLRKLGVKGPIQGKTLTNDQQIAASRAIVEKTQFKVDPQDLPGWASSPGGKLVAQFRTFSYNQGKFVSNEVLKPMRTGNYRPFARLLAALPVGYAVYESRRLINNRPEETNQARLGAEVFNNIGGGGLVTDIFRGLVPLNGKYVPPDRRTSMAVGTLGGPTAGAAADLVGGISDAIQRKNVPAAGLDGKVAVANNGDQYTDLTSLARTGLRQVPIIGTRLQNTLVPYTQPDKPVQLVPGASAAESAPVPAAVPDNGSILTGDNTTPQAKKNAQDATKLKKAQVDAGLRLGGTKELDAAQTRIDTAAKKFPEGLSKDSQTVLTRYAKLNTNGKDKFNADLNNVYNLKAAQYEEKKRAGGMSNLEDYKAQQDLYRAKVQKDFSPDAVKLYGMSKAALRDYFASNPTQRALFNEVQQLDSALTGSGLQDKNKFYNGLSSTSGSKGSFNTAKYHVSLSAGGSAKPKVATSTTKSIKRSAKRKAGAKPKVSIRKSVA